MSRKINKNINLYFNSRTNPVKRINVNKSVHPLDKPYSAQSRATQVTSTVAERARRGTPQKPSERKRSDVKGTRPFFEAQFLLGCNFLAVRVSEVAS